MLSVTAVAQQRRQPAQEPVHTHLSLGYTVRSLGGITIAGGGSYKQHEAELQLALGLQGSTDVHWYDDAGVWLSSLSYHRHALQIGYGYVFRAGTFATVTPQAALGIAMLSGSLDEGSKSYANSAMASTATIGIRLAAQVMQHVSIIVTPHYGLTISQDAYFRGAANTADFSAGGFGVTVGAMIEM